MESIEDTKISLRFPDLLLKTICLEPFFQKWRWCRQIWAGQHSTISNTSRTGVQGGLQLRKSSVHARSGSNWQKKPPKITGIRKFVKLTSHTYTCNNLTGFNNIFIQHIHITGNGNDDANLLKSVRKNSWNQILGDFIFGRFSSFGISVSIRTYSNTWQTCKILLELNWLLRAQMSIHSLYD